MIRFLIISLLLLILGSTPILATQYTLQGDDSATVDLSGEIVEDEVIVEFDPGAINYQISIEITNVQDSEGSANYALHTYKATDEANYTYNGVALRQDNFTDLGNFGLTVNHTLPPSTSDVFIINIVDACGIDCVEYVYFTFGATGENNTLVRIESIVLNQGTSEYIDFPLFGTIGGLMVFSLISVTVRRRILE